ncbi:MAG TPA: SDR family NAD(P)-dependent oxidoreductase, partial [Pirellulales bacterium]|nr:SDR family NAD(P)-dependent oxidoreductase [Pirellulales bacterium]
MKRAISGSRSLVTGASGGIGRAIARELGRQGSSVLLVARRAAALEQLAAEIRSAGGRAELVVGDVTEAAIRRAALDRARDAFGGLDILVNNAGRGAMGRFAEASPERLRQVFELNFFAAVELIREALPLLQQGRQPIVVNI